MIKRRQFRIQGFGQRNQVAISQLAVSESIMRSALSWDVVQRSESLTLGFLQADPSEASLARQITSV